MKYEKPFLIQASLKREKVESYDRYPFSIPAVRALDRLTFHRDVTFLVGENGSGKSTLIEAIALALGFGAQGGTKNVKLESAGDISPLHEYLSLARGLAPPRDGYFLRAESFYNVATYMDEVGYLDEYGGKSLHARSHGEAFMSTLNDKLRGDGLYLLDEPEAALSPSRQLAALATIHDLVLDNSQLIIATHSPILLAYPRSKILQLDASGITEVQYEETEHYSVTKKFLTNHKRMLHHLIGGSE